MSTFEELKKTWEESQSIVPTSTPYDHGAINNIVRSRTQKHLNASMQYFWASFTLQNIVYALLVHVIVRYGSDSTTLLFAIGGVLLFIPFTVTLMRKFKRMAITKPKEGNSGASLRDYIQQQYALLKSFYAFKRRYEFILIPLSTAVGTFLTFRLYVPGGVLAHKTGAIITFAITIISCAFAIASENRKSFEQPLRNLQNLMAEFKLQG